MPKNVHYLKAETYIHVLKIYALSNWKKRINTYIVCCIFVFFNTATDKNDNRPKILKAEVFFFYRVWFSLNCLFSVFISKWSILGYKNFGSLHMLLKLKPIHYSDMLWLFYNQNMSLYLIMAVLKIVNMIG